eukprot:1293036-Lingulodinium_polyedra.AAC.1
MIGKPCASRVVRPSCAKTCPAVVVNPRGERSGRSRAVLPSPAPQWPRKRGCVQVMRPRPPDPTDLMSLWCIRGGWSQTYTAEINNS